MPFATTTELLQVLSRYALLEPVPLDETRRVLATALPDPPALCRELMKREWLTPYQVNQIFQDQAAGLLLGPYVLLDKISESAMGDVFKARHQHMRRIVGLQVIRPDLLKTPGAVERFYEEVQAASQLTHPNIVASYDAGPIGPTHFFAMEYVEGIDLERLVQQQGPLPANQACDFIRQAALGLQHAWERGLRHHDLKPANLLVNHGAVTSKKADSAQPVPLTQQIKVRNLGLTVIRQPTKHTRLGDRSRVTTAFSTADYIAPERVTSGNLCDIRAELYSLGCCLYYLLAGQVPFPAASIAEKHRAHQELQPRPLESLRADVSPQAAAILNRLMAKNPDERYQSPAEVAAALAALPAPKDTERTPAAALAIWRQRRAAEQRLWRRRVLAGSAVLAVCLFGFFGLLFWQNTTATPPTQVARPSEPEKLVLASEPALVVQCGRTKAGSQTEVLQRGYGYQLVQGDLHDGWGPPVIKSHAWVHGDEVRFLLRVPTATTGVVRLHFVTESDARRQRLYLNGKPVGDVIEKFGGGGKHVEVPLSFSDLRDGRAEIGIRNLVMPGSSAVVSTVEFVPWVRGGELPPPETALLIQCGKQEEVIGRGYGWRLHKGMAFDTWPQTAGRSHGWLDGERVHFDLTVPKGIAGTLRLFFVNGDNAPRKQKLIVHGREIGEYSSIPVAGQWIDVKLTPEDTKDGRIEVVIQNLNKDSSAVVSTIEFRPAGK
jgi:serine/threonine protein kinase